MLSTRNDFKHKNINRLKRKDEREIYHANIDQEKAVVTILISEKINYRAKKIIRNKVQFIMMKGWNHQEHKHIIYKEVVSQINDLRFHLKKLKWKKRSKWKTEERTQ